MRRSVGRGVLGGVLHVPLSALFVSSLVLAGGCTAPSGGFYRVSAEFNDVLDLVPQASVKVNDVTVGSVEDISLRGWTAVVRLRVDENVKLPDNANAAIRQSSLLGEKFVALEAPAEEPAQGQLSDGDLIPLDRTRQSAEVEEVLAALGLVLNGSGLQNLKTINKEVAEALNGRESEAKNALRNLDEFITGLDAQKGDIVRAIEALDRLSVRLAEQTDTIGQAVEALDPGLSVLAQQRAHLTEALVALDNLSTVGVNVINQSRDDTIATLKALQPLLDNLVEAGDDLPKSLDFMLSYPFPPNVQQAIVGDKVNLHLTLELDAVGFLTQTLISPDPTEDGLLPGLLPGLDGLLGGLLNPLLPQPDPSGSTDPSRPDDEPEPEPEPCPILGSLCDLLGRGTRE